MNKIKEFFNPKVRSSIYKIVVLLATYFVAQGIIDGETANVVVGVVGILTGVLADVNVDKETDSIE